jgi:4-amino-4-deoxy-L-arabinose transferase-like glycosyltransferase
VTVSEASVPPEVGTPTDPASPRRRASRHAPADQPGWARPALFGIAVLSAALYTWRAGIYLEWYYAAAVRSMSMSWHNFFFAAFDPAGTVSLDKLPGAFWLQALSVRVFGLHTWAIIFPQVVEGVLSVLVLYRIVRRLCGPVAGLVAAGSLALSPATVALNRGNISDTLMVLLLLLAADAAVSSVTTGRWRGMLLAGMWVGLAFQAKMVEAWIALPALGLLYLVSAPGPWLQRLQRIVVMGIVAAVVSLSWMTVVTLTPASTRPYVDGSQDNSLFQQVFVYNGFGRFDQLSPNQLLTRSIGLKIGIPPHPAWDRLLMGAFGRDIAWLIPAALIALVAGLAETRRHSRGDLMRASYVLWGTWLLAFAAVFSFSSSINTYYTAALSPALAGLVATGSVRAWQRRESIRVRLVVAATVLITAGYAAWLLPARGTGLPGWLAPLVIALGIAAAVVGLLSSWQGAPRRLLPAGLAVSLVTVMLVPAVASVSIATSRLGSFDTPFQPMRFTLGVRAFFEVTSPTEKLLPRIEDVRRGAPYLLATQTSALAAPFIFVTGQEVLPIGGYTGTIPEPTLAAIKSMVRSGRFHLVVQSASTTDPRLVWIARHCISVPQPAGVAAPLQAQYAIHYCLTRS